MELAPYFERVQRDGGVTLYVRLKAGHPDWLQDAVYAAHDREMPNDWRYEQCKYIAAAIDDGNDDAMDIADGLVDPYTRDLLTWVSGNLNRVGYVDEAVEELAGAMVGIESAIRLGQFRCLTDMAQVMIDAANEHADDDDDEDDS